MVTEERSTEPWGPRPGEDWKAHRMRVFANYPDILAVLRVAESRVHETEIWREWRIHMWEGDPELQELQRKGRFELDSPPEMDEQDLRAARRHKSPYHDELHQKFVRWYCQRFPQEADAFAEGA